MLRRALKPELRADALKRDESHVRITPWLNGRPARKYLCSFSKKGFFNQGELPLVLPLTLL